MNETSCYKINGRIFFKHKDVPCKRRVMKTLGVKKNTFAGNMISRGIIELVYIVLQSVVKPGITGFFKIDLHIKCYIYLS